MGNHQISFVVNNVGQSRAGQQTLTQLIHLSNYRLRSEPTLLFFPLILTIFSFIFVINKSIMDKQLCKSITIIVNVILTRMRLTCTFPLMGCTATDSGESSSGSGSRGRKRRPKMMQWSMSAPVRAMAPRQLISATSHSVKGAIRKVPIPDPQTAIPVAKDRYLSKQQVTETIAGKQISPKPAPERC